MVEYIMQFDIDDSGKLINARRKEEVIRCEDCKHYHYDDCDRYADETLGYVHSTQPNYFCAVPERKGE